MSKLRLSSSDKVDAIRLTSADMLKSRRTLLALGGVIVVLLAWYFLFWKPEASKLSSVHAQQATAVSQQQQLNNKLRQIIREDQFVAKYHNFLTYFDSQVPVQPEQGQLVYVLGKLQSRDHVDITTLSASSTAAPTTGTTLSTIPISMTVTGTHNNVIQFLSGLYGVSRLITVQSISPSPTAAPSPSYDVLGHDKVPFTMSISATAYFSGTIATDPPGQVSTAGTAG